MKLIIAEKPSLARNICAGIGEMKKKNGYYEGRGYIVSWAFGHLFSLYDVDDYSDTKEQTRWTMDNLPFFPKEFKFKLRGNDNGVKKQFEIIKELCNREDVDTIINAGDADREGEIIVRLCVNNSLKENHNKSLLRIWLPDQTPQTVKKALTELKPESEYDNLANEGFGRTYIDWLFGINYTRYATLKSGAFLRVGRVIIPIVKTIYDRDMLIKDFVPEKYYGIVSKEKTNDYEIELTSKEKFKNTQLDRAKCLCDKYNSCEAIVKNVKKKKETLNPGKLFSLSKLQNVVGKMYKLPPDKTLSIAQSLYEKGYLTYPRSNSEYLAEAEKDKIKQIINEVSKIGYPVKFKDKKTIFDDKKIESHSAITPTYKIPQKNSISDEEFKVYQIVFKRFVAVFCSEDCIANKTEIKISVGDYEEFTLNGTVIVEPGFTKFEAPNVKNKVLPALSVGDKVNINFMPKEKETSAPKHYTVETLNNFLKNPYRDIKAEASESENEDDMEEYKALFEGVEIGTEATRASIIGNAISSEYIALKNNTYTIQKNGIFLIESLMKMNINMDREKTAHLGRALKKIFRNEISVQDGIKIAEDEISEVFKRTPVDPENDTDTGIAFQNIGVCPVCGKDIIRGRYYYGCSGYKDGCSFKIPLYLCKRNIPVSAAKDLLTNGKTVKLKGFISKKGTTFDAVLITSDNGVAFDFK